MIYVAKLSFDKSFAISKQMINIKANLFFVSLIFIVKHQIFFIEDYTSSQENSILDQISS